MNKKIEIKMYPLEKLELNEGQLKGLGKNPRYIKEGEFEKLKKSISDSPEFLEARPLLAYPLDNGNYIVIAGNMRLRAARELSFKEIPCYIFDKKTPIKKLKEYTIKDNVEFGSTDWDELANGEWNVEELQDWGVDCSFLTDTEPVEEKPERKETEDDAYDEDEHEIEAKCKLGDIWQLGRHRLMCGDSTDASQVAKLLGGANIQLYLTDPPYNVAYGYEGAATEKKRKDGLVVLNDKMDNDKFEVLDKRI